MPSVAVAKRESLQSFQLIFKMSLIHYHHKWCLTGSASERWRTKALRQAICTTVSGKAYYGSAIILSVGLKKGWEVLIVRGLPTGRG
jgi:hypothetical protein